MTLNTNTPSWVKLAVLSLCGLVASLQFTMVIPLLPDFPSILGVSAEGASWVVTTTLVSAAVCTPIISKMADMYGKRRMLLIALAALVLGSVVCALSSSFGVLLVGRALQGSATSLIAVGISVLRDELPPAKVSASVAVMSATLGIGNAFGLPLSGVLVEHFGWQAIFWFTAGGGTLLAICLFLAVPQSSLRTRGRFDILGAVVLSGALVALLLPLTNGASWGWLSAAALGSTSLGLVILAIWVPLELSVSQPIVDIRTASKRPVLCTNLASLLVSSGLFLNILVTMRLLQAPSGVAGGLGLSTTEAGLAMIPSGLAMLAVAPVAGTLLNRFGGRRVLIAGASIMTVAFMGRNFFSQTLAEVIVGSALVGLGLAVAFSAMPTLIMSYVPLSETASANGLNSLSRSLGQALASALATAVFSATSLGGDGPVVLSATGLHVVLSLGVAATLAAAILATLIPRTPRTIPGRSLGAEFPRSAPEVILRGKLARPDGAWIDRPGVATAFSRTGLQLDWARTDSDGQFSLVLPGPGEYVVVTNAQGWAPSAHVLDFDGSSHVRVFTLEDELTVSGTVILDGEPCGRALVAMSGVAGDQVALTSADELGAYALPLPPPGRYLLTAIMPSALAVARKTELGLQSVELDLSLTNSSVEPVR
jgi:predicted MFS family arabinose efflux permease